jgi:hypothetical protein
LAVAKRAAGGELVELGLFGAVALAAMDGADLLFEALEDLDLAVGLEVIGAACLQLGAGGSGGTLGRELAGAFLAVGTEKRRARRGVEGIAAPQREDGLQLGDVRAHGRQLLLGLRAGMNGAGECLTGAQFLVGAQPGDRMQWKAESLHGVNIFRRRV